MAMTDRLSTVFCNHSCGYRLTRLVSGLTPGLLHCLTALERGTAAEGHSRLLIIASPDAWHPVWHIDMHNFDAVNLAGRDME